MGRHLRVQTRELRPRESPQRPWTRMSLAKSTASIDVDYAAERFSVDRRCDGSTFPSLTARLDALGIPTGPDKLLQEVIRMILEAYYEPQFSDRVPRLSARNRRGCHTALSRRDQPTGPVSSWFVEFDIKGCFDNIDHEVGCMLGAWSEKLHDNRCSLRPAQVPTESRLR